MSATAPVNVSVLISSQNLSTAAPTAVDAAPFAFDAANVTEEFSLVSALNTYTTDTAALANAMFNFLEGKVSGATPIAQAHVEVRITDDSLPANIPGFLPPKDVYDITLGPNELTDRATIQTNLNAAVAAARAFTGF